MESCAVPLTVGQPFFLSNLVKSLRDPVYVLQPSNGFRMVYVNSACCQHFGYTEEELLCMAIPDFDPRFSLADCRAIFEEIKVKGTATFESEHRLKSGQTVPVEVTSSYLLLDGQEFLGGFIQNIAGRKAMERELKVIADRLRKSNSELEQFVYLASHDLREPLRMVISYLQLLDKKSHERLDGEARDYLNQAINGARRMHYLLADLLSYSTLGAQTGAVPSVSVAQVMKNVLANLKGLIRETKASVLYGELPSVAMPAAHLTLVFQNLIENAIKYRREAPPQIRIEVNNLGKSWMFKIVDNGLGIPPEQVERIFQMFKRLHSQSQIPGTGIGLAMCKKIVEMHGGKIWAESKPGDGSSFCFTVPIADPPAH